MKPSMKQSNLKVLNPGVRESAGQVSGIVFGNSYLIFILVLLISICFSTYSISTSNALIRDFESKHEENLMRMKELQDLIGVTNVYLAKIEAKNSELIKENNKLKEELGK